MNLKKIIISLALILGLFLIIRGVEKYLFNRSIQTLTQTCAFCQDSVLSSQKFYEDDYAVVLYTHKPILPGHCLIIPKRHVERYELLTDEEILAMGKLVKKVNQAVQNVFKTSSYLLLQKNGSEVGQTVPHVHIHYIPRQANDYSILNFLAKMFWISNLYPINPEEIIIITDKLERAMNASN